jgi:hypothetical protein
MKRIVYASDCYPCPDCCEPVCPVCHIHYAECDCPGPDNADDYGYDSEPFENYNEEQGEADPG